MSNMTLIVQKLVSTGWNFSMDTTNLSLLIVKLTVLSLKYIDKQKLWEKLFCDSENNHVDWSLIKPDFNAFNDLYFWIPLIEQCYWGNSLADCKNPIIQHIKQSLQLAGVDYDPQSYDLACQLLILHLLQGIPVLYAFEQLTCRKFNKDTHHVATILLSNISNILYKPEEYEVVLQEILHNKNIKIHTEVFQEKLDLLNSQQETIKVLSKQNTQSFLSNGRPRLRDLLEFSTKEKTQLDTKLGTWESYQSYCQLHQFPNILNEVTKQKIYFLVSQTKWQWQEHVAAVVGHHGEMTDKIIQYPVMNPDVDILYFCIQRLNVNGRPPFKELLLFKNKCFINFPLSMFQTMNLTQFLRLFVCIYQNEQVWKELWKMQNVLFSPQVIKDCELFSAQNPFPVEDFMRFFA